jgi:5'-nucleotidase
MAKTSIKKPAAKSGLRILVTNDDGIHAPGLKALVRIAKKISNDVWVIAPEEEQSGTGHSLSLAHPVRLRKIGPRKFAIRGTPTDCVLMAVRHIMKDEKPDLVLSGVNRGQNIADDVTYSGTVAAAMEGTQLGIPSIALSQAFGFDKSPQIKWATAERYAPDIIRKLLKTGWPSEVLINVNFPDVGPNNVKGIEVTGQGKRDQSLVMVDERVDARHKPYFWFGFEPIASKPAKGTDLHAVYNGFISVCPLHMNLTHTQTRAKLVSALGKM